MGVERFLELVRTALTKIPAGYYWSEEWTESALDHLGLGQRDNRYVEAFAYLSRHGERIFCYELYHQIRSLMEAEGQQEDSRILLQAELKKDQLGAQLEKLFDVQALTKEYFPDFLLHLPGSFEHQELVIEVKANPHLSFSSIKQDLEKIEEFISRYRYKKGLLLAVNTPAERIREILHEASNQRWIADNVPHRSQIALMSKECPAAELFEQDLSEVGCSHPQHSSPRCPVSRPT